MTEQTKAQRLAEYCNDLANELALSHPTQDLDEAADELRRLDAENAAQRDEIARLRVDAERYRWLRDVSVPPHNFYISVPDEFHGVRYTPDQVNEYIDAAMKGTK